MPQKAQQTQPAGQPHPARHLRLPSPQQTRALGRALGRALPSQAVCLLFGELGAGKTTLAKAICEGLGLPPREVISPTYTLVNIYPGPPSVYHVDFFRIEQPEALLQLDPNDWINPEGVTLIEWPEMALPLLAGQPTLALRLTAPTSAAEHRELTVSGDAGQFQPVFDALAPFEREV